ncbi:seryl-tRNA synthetase [Exophiala aquamarina CBS 119918]|uniref:serine--tRNA ligase n=1 Tax=Exophiala aquamarina CBS 119918 TaxID=1182545 RepID=A0A072PQM4_9EURO|nr:seryl-tRNA synthetase [Exophiala aquamarina CBS 119918]KEF61643.1 seryl-tRNA synthetase [Exophiala aquamarina CBS 119918]
MIDPQDLIASRGGDPKKIIESQRRRYAPAEIVDEAIDLWNDAYQTRYKASQIGAKINAVQKEIGKLRKAKQDATDLLQEKTDLEKQKKQIEDEALEKERLRDRKCKAIGNYVHESVPVNDNEDFNEVVKQWAPEGVTVEKKDCLSHHEVMTRAEVYDGERGVKLVGHRGYFLRKWGVLLNQALINYGLHFLYAKGYDPIQPPFFMKAEYMAKTAQLEQFDEELYKVIEDKDSEDKYLIATSEQPLSAMFADEWLTEKDVPKKFAGYSTCFRKEAGAHGRDAWGLYRIHQFEKIEQFIFTKPEDSWQALEDMKTTAEEFYQSLGLPYRVVVIVSGALNNAAAKKYDLEAWFPYQGEYKELVSCSNCTDYQTRELEIRYGQKKGAIDSRKTYAHALNGTLCATERTLCCILENYQKEDGFEVPEVLKRYMPPGTPDIIPYTKDLPKESISQKAKQPAKPKAEGAPDGGPKLNPPADSVADKLKDLKT